MTLATKPVSHYRPRRREISWEPLMRRLPEKPPLFEWVLLSIVLHALAITLFGAPLGGSSEGHAMWGSLQVVLTGLAPEPSPLLRLDRGGLEAPPTLPAAPAKPSLRAAPRIEPSAPPIEAPPLPEAAPKVEPIAIPPVLQRLITPERQIEVPPPAFIVPPPTENQAPAPVPTPEAPTPPPAAPPKETLRLPQVERAPAEVPKISAPLMQPISPTIIPERVTAPPQLEIPRVESPVVPAIPAPPVITQPLEAKSIPAPSIQELAPVPHIETIAKPVEVPAPVAPAPAVAPQAEPRAEPAQAQQREAPQTLERAPATRESPSFRPVPVPVPGPSAPGVPGEARKRGDEPSSNYDPFAPGLDVDAMKRRAGQMARGTGNSALLPFAMPAVPPKKSKMEQAIENARKPDCRTAYAELGLAAIVPLVANEFGEGNCRW